MPEAKLAREAELHYASVAMVTDYDCWHETHAHVTVEAVVAVMSANAANARALLRLAIPRVAGAAACPLACDLALDHAVITPAAARDPALMARLDAVAGRVLAQAG
jgi:5'-methylthioadenosine phosphorylase